MTKDLTFAPSRTFFSVPVDYLLIGGLSIVLYPVMWLIPWNDHSLEQMGIIAYTAVFIANYPHFTVSYQLLYNDYRHLLFKDFRFFWAAVVIPVLLLFYFVWLLSSGNKEGYGYIAAFMFFIVGWHYTKQAYGAVMVAAARSRYYFSDKEKNWLKANMYGLWFTSFLSFNIGMHESEYWGVYYPSFGFTKYWLYAAYAFTLFTLIEFVFLMLKRIRNERKLPPVISIIPFVAIYFWDIPVLFHPAFFLITPFFHSIQYLFFVAALKRNEYESRSHRTALRKTAGYMGLALLTGVVFFEGIPRLVEMYHPLAETAFGHTRWLFIFSVFINIHHYFIDNVIWRKDNKILGQYLVHS